MTCNSYTALRSEFTVKRAPSTLFAAFLHFDVSFMIWVILGPLALFIAKDLDLSITQKALLVSLPPLGGAFFRVVLGYLSDQFGAKRVGVASMAITLVPLMMGWLVGTTYGMMLGIAFLLGIAGASFAVSLPLASRWYPPERQGIVMGVAGAGNSGTVFATLFAPMIAAKVGWHATMALATIPVLIALAVFTFMAYDSPTQPAPKKLGDYVRVARNGDTWWFCFFYSITFGGFLGFVSYLAIFFNTAYGVDKVAVGGLVAIASLLGSALRPGRRIHRGSHRRHRGTAGGFTLPLRRCARALRPIRNWGFANCSFLLRPAASAWATARSSRSFRSAFPKRSAS